MARARRRNTGSRRSGGVASSLEISGTHIPIKVKRPTLEIAKESGANITVRDVPGGYKGIFIGTGGHGHKPPTKREMINGVHSWADALTHEFETHRDSFASRNYKQAPKRPWLLSRKKTKRRWKAYEFHEKVKREDWQRVVKKGKKIEYIDHPAISKLLEAWQRTIEAEKRKLSNIVDNQQRMPDEREFADAVKNVTAAKQALLNAVSDYQIEFSRIRGMKKMPAKGHYPPMW